MRRRTMAAYAGGVAGIAVVAGLAFAANYAGASSSPSTGGFVSDAAARSLAETVATNAVAATHQTATTGVTYVQSTRQLAVNLDEPGASVDSNQPVVVVVLHGSFAVNAGGLVHVPITGDTDTLIVDSATGTITDSSIGNTAPNLTALGAPASLPDIAPAPVNTAVKK